jgi:tyrosyl-tRNA synthetase
MPLVVNKATGRKFGKSEAGAIWLDPKLTSPTQFYQFWINVEDDQAEEFLKIYTMLPKEEIEDIIDEHRKNPAERNAQRRLAEEITELVHGREENQTARVITNVLTGRTAVGEVSPGIIEQMREEVPHEQFKKTPSVVDALVATGLAASKTEARRLLSGGAVYVNGSVVTKENLDSSDFKNGRLMLRRGKAFKDSALIELV